MVALVAPEVEQFAVLVALMVILEIVIIFALAVSKREQQAQGKEQLLVSLVKEHYLGAQEV